VGHLLETYDFLGLSPAHASGSDEFYTSLTTMNKYPANYGYTYLPTGLMISDTSTFASTLGRQYLNSSNNRIMVSQAYYYSANVLYSSDFFMIFIRDYQIIVPPVSQPITEDFVILQASFNNYQYALLVASNTTYFNASFAFPFMNGNLARIFHYSIFSQDASFSGSTPIGPIEFPEPVNLTYWALNISNSNAWAIKCYVDSFIDDISSYPHDKFIIASFDYTTSPLRSDPIYYKTVQSVTSFAHNSSVRLRCSIQVNFNGILRGLFFNEDYLLSGSSLHPDVNITLISTDWMYVIPSNMFYVTAIGYKLFVNEISLVNCVVDVDSIPYSGYVKLEQYVIESLYWSTTVYYQSNTTTIAPNCQTSRRSDYCYICNPGYFQLFKICYSPCPDADSYISNKKFCESTFRSQALRNSLVSKYNQSTGFSDSFQIDFYSQFSNLILVLFYPMIPASIAINKISTPPASSISSLVESKSYITNRDNVFKVNASGVLELYQSPTTISSIFLFTAVHLNHIFIP
jgi:hypothetical protein